MTRIRDIARILGKTEAANTENVALSSGANVTAYDSSKLLPTSSLDSGELAYVHNTKRMYSWTGNEWYEVERLNNTDPSITVNANYTFDSSNAPDIVIDTQLTDPQLLDMYLDTVTTVPTNAVDSAVDITIDSDAGIATFSLKDGGTLKTFKSIFTAFEHGGFRSVQDSATFTIDRIGILSVTNSIDSGGVTEGMSFTVTVTTRGVSDSANVNYTFAELEDADFTNANASGIIVINNDSGSKTFITNDDGIADSANARITISTDEANDSADLIVPISDAAQPIAMEALIVGGGGAGGSRGAPGGGGAGEVVDLQSAAQFSLDAGTYTVTVGAGGAAPSPLHTGGRGSSGSNSVFMSIQALGGGAGGGYQAPQGQAGTVENALSGGSGGGAISTGTVGQAQQGSGGYNSYRFGNAGGLGSQAQNANYVGGGGGGAGAVGGAGVGAQMGQRGPGGQGGAGRQVAITGTQVWYGGGGGGGAYCGSVGGGDGGQGGGGDGADNQSASSGSAGQANTGGGGGAGDESCGSQSVAGGKAGGSGIVVIAIQQQNGSLAQIQAQLQYTSSTQQRSGYTVYTFTGGSGNVTVQ